MARARSRRIIPAGFYKCSGCGRTLPDSTREPDLPEEWSACRPCAAARRAEYRHPQRNQWGLRFKEVEGTP